MKNSKFNYIESVAFSDTGLVRTNNEDSFDCLAGDGCFFVSDGMGGGDSGEIASQFVTESITDSVSNSKNDSPGSRKYAVQQAIHRANNQIQHYSQSHGFHQMGATIVLLLFDSWEPGQALICHVGDSRVYRMRKNKLEQLTTDHTIGAELAERTSQKNFSSHQNNAVSHILTRAVGTSANVIPEWQNVEVFPEDIFLICSDGVSTMLADDQISAIINSSSQLTEICSNLSEAIRRAGANDNYTFILCRILPDLPEMESHCQEDINENEYLLKIAEERIDHA